MAEPAPDTELIAQAAQIRLQAYAPYSGFQVGAALRGEAGLIFTGVNVENIAYPEGTCAEAGAIAALCAAGGRQIRAIAIIADAPEPVAPCGGCRQKIAEFAAPDLIVTMATTSGLIRQLPMRELLPGAFGRAHFAAPDHGAGEG